MTTRPARVTRMAVPPLTVRLLAGAGPRRARVPGARSSRTVTGSTRVVVTAARASRAVVTAIGVARPAGAVAIRSGAVRAVTIRPVAAVGAVITAGVLRLAVVAAAAMVRLGKCHRPAETREEQARSHQAGRRGDANARSHSATTPRSPARRPLWRCTDCRIIRVHGLLLQRIGPAARRGAAGR